MIDHWCRHKAQSTWSVFLNVRFSSSQPQSGCLFQAVHLCPWQEEGKELEGERQKASLPALRTNPWEAPSMRSTSDNNLRNNFPGVRFALSLLGAQQRHPWRLRVCAEQALCWSWSFARGGQASAWHTCGGLLECSQGQKLVGASFGLSLGLALEARV